MKIIVSLLVALITGCATTPVPTNMATEVPDDRVIEANIRKAINGFGQVIVKRDSGLNTSACNSRIFVNGKPIADIGPGEKVTFYLPPGEHMIAAIAKGICAGGLVEARTTATPARTSVLRISYGTNGEFTIQPTAF